MVGIISRSARADTSGIVEERPAGCGTGSTKRTGKAEKEKIYRLVTPASLSFINRISKYRENTEIKLSIESLKQWVLG